MTYRTLSRCGVLLALFSLGLVAAETSRPIEAYNRLPLRFEPNRGQRPSPVEFVSRGPDHELLLSPGEAVLAVGPGQSAPVRLQWIGAVPAKRAKGAKELPGRSNYFIGTDSTKWLSDIPNYAQVRYDSLYPGIDLVFHGRQGQLEFDYVVSPRVDPAAIRLRVEGANLRVDAEGDLVLSAAGAEVRLKRPFAYQESAGLRRKVEARYALRHGNEVGFRLGRYDQALPLVIDPVLSFSTLLGGWGQDSAAGVALDSAGNIYLTGYTRSSDFPVLNSLQPFRVALCYSGRWPPYQYGNCSEVFISKLDPTGTTLLYSTLLGGDGDDSGAAIAVDDSGNAYVTGQTNSTNFPTAGAHQPVGPATGTFVAKLGTTGNLIYSTYPGGAAIAVDHAGNAYVAGSTGSTDFPTVQPLQDALATAWLFRSSDRGATWGPDRTDGVLATALQFDPTNPLTRYGWNRNSDKCWKTEDGGKTWRLILSPEILEPLHMAGLISAISIDRDSPSTIYAALEYQGAVKSVNGGDSWTAINDGLPGGPFVYMIYVDPARPATLYAATGYGVFKSTDAGAHWQSTPPLPSTGSQASQVIRLLIADPLDPSALYAAGNGGVFKLSEDGTRWTALNSGFPNGYADIESLVLDPRNPLTLYARHYVDLWKSSNGGANWTMLNVAVDSADNSLLAVDPSTSTVYVQTSSGHVLSSADGGATWSPAGLPVSASVRSLVWDPSAPHNIYATVDAAVSDAFLAKFSPTGALLYSTFLGGTGTDYGTAVAVDSSGSAFVAGTTSSMDFPSPGAVQRDKAGNGSGSDVFVAKLNPAGSALVWSALFGGYERDELYALALDPPGNAYVTGLTDSSDFPTVRALQAVPGGDEDAFVAKLDAASGALVYSTYLGGSYHDRGLGIAVGVNGSAYVVGQGGTDNFPLRGTLQTGSASITDAFVAKLNPSGTTLVYSALLGGRGDDIAYSIAVDSAGSAYVAGETYSSDFPGVPLQPFLAEKTSAFVLKVAADSNTEAVVNAASYATEPGAGLAPGTTVAIFGDALATGTQAASAVPLPRDLLETTVTFNGIPAPLFFVSGSQVNAQIPFEVTSGTASVVLKRGDVESPAFQIHVADVSPGVFTMNMQGTGEAVIVHSTDFRLVTRSDPAVPGEYLTFYATGLGQPTAPVPTGGAPPQPFPEAFIKPQVTIAGVPASVSWAGPAPTLVGVFQVNILMPAGVPAGEQVLQLRTNGIPANPVTLAVR